MSNKIQDNIVSLLENIIKRSEIIESQKDIKSLLDIDLAMSDIRELYKEYEKLRKIAGTESKPAFHQAEPTPPQEEEIKIKHFREPEKEIAPKQENLGSDKTENTVKSESEPAVESPKESDSSKEKPAKPEEKETPAAEESPTHTNEASEKPAEEKNIDSPKEPTENNSVTETPAHKAPREEKPQQEKTPIKEAPRAYESKPEPARSTKASENGSKSTSSPILGETLKATNYSVYEHLANLKEDKSIGSKLQQKAITNLKDGIGINEKFLFINELFNGDIQAYNQAINQLNSYENIHQAFEHINELSRQFIWDGERSSETIEKFANLVQRRHIAL